jgi:hypothetical protein
MPQNQQIEGLPPGAIVRPIRPAQQKIEGLPPGAIVRPIQQARVPASAPPPAPKPTFTQRHPILSFLGSILEGVEKGANNTLGLYQPIPKDYASRSELYKFFHPIVPGVADLAQPPQGPAEKAGYFGEQAAEYMSPAGEEEIGAKLLAKYPRIGKLIMEALRSGAISRLQGTGFVPGVVAGGAGSMLGEGLAAVGGKIGAKQLKYGARPEDEILHLKGVRPSTVRKAAQEKALQLTKQMESMLSAHSGTVDLTPAKQAVQDAVDKANLQHDLKTLEHLKTLRKQVNSFPDKASALQALNLKRGLQPLTSFHQTGELTDAARGAARSAYHAIDDELNKVSPKVDELNQRIQSLLTIAKPRGTGKIRFGRYLLPGTAAYLTERETGDRSDRVIAPSAAFLLATAAETPAGRIALAKAAGKYGPKAIKATYPFLLRAVKKSRKENP